MTTIVSVRRNGKVVIGGDGQVSLGNTVLKANARKVRKLNNGTIISGFAGSTADAFTLLDIFEEQVKSSNGNFEKGVISSPVDSSLLLPSFPLYGCATV